MTRMLAQGRISELIGSEGLQIDKYIRKIGITRATEARIASLPKEEEVVFLNYAAGINKVVENIKVYPAEFQILFASFEPWTVRDSVACQYLYNAFVSTDWFAEMLRVRLLEVYDKDLVDKILPFKPEDFYEFKNMQTIPDEDSNTGDDNELYAKLFKVDESLLYMPPKTDKIRTESSQSRPYQEKAAINLQTGSGTNCFAVHGNYTQKGKPFLACDPHLMKAANSYFYLTRMTWNETHLESPEGALDDPIDKSYLIGATLIGVP